MAIGRLQEFLTAHGLQPQPTGPTTTTRWAGWLCAGLPSVMSTEVIAWLEVLTATNGRGRARARSTIDHYTAAVAPALTGLAARYDSLRQVSEDDIAAQLEPLRGSARTATAVALRSLFATLKSRRLIFADPTRRVHPGRFPHERRRRWPATANPHLLISTRSALGLGPVSAGYLRGVTANLPVTLHQLRADRLLTHARDTGGDPLSLHRLFGLSADTAVRYCTELDVPIAGTTTQPNEPG